MKRPSANPAHDAQKLRKKTLPKQLLKPKRLQTRKHRALHRVSGAATEPRTPKLPKAQRNAKPSYKRPKKRLLARDSSFSEKLLA